MSFVTTEIQGAVAIVTIDRPKALNALNPEVLADLKAAFEAIDQNPNFAEAYYNRGIIQIFMKDTRKGCLDISKAGELGIVEAYEVLKRYAPTEK